MEKPDTGYAFLNLVEKPDEATLNTIDEINAVIRSTGCAIYLHTNHDGSYTVALAIHYDTAKNSRGAGRHKKLVSMQHLCIRCGEVRKMLATKTADEVAAELEVSRATLFRRLKGKEDNQLF